LFSVSPKEEAKLGEEAARQIEAQVRLVHGPVEDWVNAVGQRLAKVSDPKWKYSFRVIDSPEVNAFALPGGYVYVFTGLRKVVQTDDELAAVLAHEITHAEQHHYAKQYKKSAKRGALLSIFSVVVGLPQAGQQVVGLANAAIGQRYARTEETEADILGVRRMVRAGFNPQGMVTLLDKLGKEDRGGNTLDSWFRAHPESDKRVGDVQKEMTQIKTLQAAGDASVKPIFEPWTSATANSSSPAASLPRMPPRRRLR
jgi:predicted Zn-dependent protease